LRSLIMGLVMTVVVASCAAPGGDVSQSLMTDTPTATELSSTTTTTAPATTTSSTSSTATVTMLIEPESACVLNPDGPYVDSFPLATSVDSLDVSDGCILAAVSGGEVLTLSADSLVPMLDGLPFDRVVSAFFAGESLWVVGRVGDYVETGLFADGVWQEAVDPEGGVPIGVSGSRVIFARAPDTRSDEEDLRMELVVYEGGTWTDYGELNGYPIGFAFDAFDTMWIPLWNSEIARCDRESCTYSNAPGAPGGTSSQIAGIASGDDGDVWLLARNALSRFDGETWTSYTSDAEYQKWGAQLEEDADSVVVVTLLGVDGSPLEPQPDFFGGRGQPFDIDVASTGDIWLGVRFHLAEERHEDSLVHVSGTTWTVHPLDDANPGTVPEMVATGGRAVWFAHYNSFSDESGDHVYLYVPPAE
jgi:hypothetical protein